MKKKLKLLTCLIVFLFFCYFLLRLFFYFNNRTNFSFDQNSELVSVFFYGLRFDLAAIAATNFLFIILFVIPISAFYSNWYQRLLKWIFILSNVPFFALNFVDVAYFHFTQKRTTSDFLTVAAMGDDFKNMLPTIIRDYWWVLVLLIGFIFLFIKGYNAIIRKAMYTSLSGKSSIYQWLILAIVIPVLIISIRGGTQFKPLNILGAAKYTSTQNVATVLNTTFTMVKTFGKEELEEVVLPTSIIADNYFNPFHLYYSSSKPFSKKNVVVIIMESFGKEYIGYFNHGIGYTPFLDSLIGKSLVCTDAFANGKKSIEGVPAIVAGLPALMNSPYINSVYGGNKLNSLPLLLRKYGYSSAFFHGGNNGTMGFENFSRMAGYDKYLGRNEYPDNSDYDGTWGIFDEPFFNFFCSKMSSMKEPFTTSIFSLSSHHPYKIPDALENKFSEGAQPIHKSVRYADYALQQFFKCASQQPWYKNTLFVITADHTGPSINNQYKTRSGIYSVPVIYFSPSDSLAGSFNGTTQQTDIVPSILNYLNYPDEFRFLGNSIFDSSANRWAISYLEGIYQLITPNSILTYDTEKVRSFTLRSNKSDPNEISTTQMNSTLNLLRVITADYNSSIIHNKLTSR